MVSFKPVSDYLSLFVLLCFIFSFVFPFKISNKTELPIKQERIFEFLSGPHHKYANCEHCGITSRSKIIGGRDAHVHDFPWMVRNKNSANKWAGHLVSIKYWDVNLCGGTLINSRYVLTAAHCVSGKLTALVSVVISLVDILDIKQVSFGVTKIIVNSRFDPETFDYDISLLRLVRTIKFRQNPWLRPVCLHINNTKLDPSDKVATVVGWGLVKEADSSSSSKLHKADLPVVSNEICQNASGLHPYVITPRMLCAGYINGGKDACQGDSGGPLLIKRHSVWLQIGIVSWGVGCAKPNYYGVYTRISSFIDWIQSNMNGWSC